MPTETPSVRLTQVTLDQLDRFAVRLVKILPRHCTIGLVGTLGAGKTRLTQAIASAVGVDSTEVTSPTFTLVQSHQGNRNLPRDTKPTDSQSDTYDRSSNITIHHIDAYRIADQDEWFEAGIEEILVAKEMNQPAWVLVEWADRFAEFMPTETIWIHIDIEPIAEPNGTISDGTKTNAAESNVTATRLITIQCSDESLLGLLQKLVQDLAESDGEST